MSVLSDLICCLLTIYILCSFSQVQGDPTISYTGLWSQYNFADKRTAPNIQGIFFTAHWSTLQPAKDEFDWSEFDKNILEITERDLPLGFRIYTGQHAPHWIYKEGVPEVKLNCSSGCNDADESVSFPFYPDTTYQQLYFRFITVFREHLETLPTWVQRNILYIQVMVGTTGDISPWHGVPADPQFQNLTEHSKDFVDYVKLTTTKFCIEYENTDPNIKVLFNRRSDLDEFYVETCPKHWIKEGMVTHGYQLNEELDAEERYMDYIRSEVDGFPIRARGENSQDTTEDGWWQQAVVSNFMVHMAWLLHFGIDFHEVSPPYISSENLRPAFEFFNRHVTDKNLEYAVGGFSYLRKELDSSDIISYPEVEFGAATIRNKERMVKIAEANMQHGAKQEDPDHGIGNPMNQRDAKRLNDVGWMIHKGNYEANMIQIEPDNTSVGRWRVGNGSTELFGRFARAFDNEVGKSEMYFSLNPLLWSGLPLTESRDLVIRVAYFDQGVGVWRLKYDGMGDLEHHGCAQYCFKITKENTLTWKEISLVIDDGYFNGRGKHGSDIWLESGDEEDDVFGLVEIYDPMIKYNLPNKHFVNIYSEAATYVDAKEPDTVFWGVQELYIRKDKRIAYFKFPVKEPECTVDKVFLKLWPAHESSPLQLHRTLQEWKADSLSWSNQPQLSKPLLSFSLENGAVFTNVDLTELVTAEPDLVGGFALTAMTSEGQQTKLHEHHQMRQESRIVIYCAQ